MGRSIFTSGRKNISYTIATDIQMVVHRYNESEQGIISDKQLHFKVTKGEIRQTKAKKCLYLPYKGIKKREFTLQIIH